MVWCRAFKRLEQYMNVHTPLLDISCLCEPEID